MLAAGVVIFVLAYLAAATLAQPQGESITPVQLLIRASGAAAFALLTLILMIGPLARLSGRFKPLLYNRRHMGVTCFVLALIHAVLVVIWYHGFAEINALVSLLEANTRYDSILGFPFESLGLASLAILFLLAATSHDFWNANFGPGLWKAIHMLVYWAYALLVAHIMLGVVQSERGLAYPVLAGAGGLLVAGLHLFAGWRERARDLGDARPRENGWIKVGPAVSIADGCAKIVAPPKSERIAVFRNGARIFALSNVCQHQGGPLGEGRIIDGCVVCPWHGFQYRPEDGRSPPPFTEKVATYRTRIEAGVVFVHADALPPGTEVAPSVMEAGA
ncbi:MAG: ferric reductase-like transmembrane domain-containing protein [Alphaproteobacteria bacterium]|nr:ferric reductase-like transmembrane domain-containing protein [Alphaproteobacteria bacterium]